jgi:hypothetical protein
MKLKLQLSMLLALCFSLSTFAQETFKTCYVKDGFCHTVTYSATSKTCKGKHIVYDAPIGIREPKSLARLGTNPQFGTLKNYTTTQEVYDHLHKEYKKNEKGNAIELDKLWNAMGYNGFTDSRFTVDKVTMVFFEAGITGMLGAGGNSYLYASISPGQDIQLKSYRITSVDGCDAYIMEICGNAFFPDRDHGTATSGNQKVSETKSPLQFDGDPANYSVTSFLKDGKCHVRICEKIAGQEGTAPEVVNNLAHNQQFGPMTDLKTSDDVIGRLKDLATANKDGNRAELNRLLRTIGYTDGINDSRFTADAIEVINYEGGVAAVMGGGDHQYMFSEISTERYKNLRGFKIRSLNDECDLTIIDVCGNALYCPQPLNCKTYECDN